MENDFFNISGITEQDEVAHFEDMALLDNDQAGEGADVGVESDDGQQLRVSLGELEDEAVLAANFENIRIEE